MSQSFTFIDAAGKQAQYTISDMDSHSDIRWRTDHGDRGVARSFGEAQFWARTALKGSMEANRRSEEATRISEYSARWRSH
jgi:hypothetical protein